MVLWYCLLSALSVHAQGVSVSGQAVVNTPTSVSGIPGNAVLQAVPNAQITVCSSAGGGIPCSPLVTIYSNVTLTTIAANPLTADINGNFSFFIPPNATGYLYSQTAPGIVGQLFNISPATTTLTAGTILCKNFENIQCVDQTLSRGGVDIWDEINKAYAALPNPSVGGTLIGQIWVLPRNDGLCYAHASNSSPVVINLATAGKPVQLHFSGACLDDRLVTASNITMITYDPGQGNGGQGGIFDLKMLGPCATQACSGVTNVTAINLGPTNGAAYTLIQNLEIGTFPTQTGYSTALNVNPNAIISQCQHCIITSSNLGVSLTGGPEGFKFVGGTISQNTTGIQTQGVGVTVQFVATQFDADTVAYNRTSTTNFTVEFMACHFENPGAIAWQAIVDSTADAGSEIKIDGGDLLEDRSSGSGLSPWFNFTGSALAEVMNFTIRSLGATVTQAFTLGNGSYYLNVLNPSASPEYNTAFTGALVDVPINGSTATRQLGIIGGYSFNFGETGNVPTGASAKDLCYGDNTAHALKCSFNNDAFSVVPKLNNAPPFSVSLRSTQQIADQGSACTNGELALGAGWQSTGSATVTAVIGTGQTCTWTITTGTTTAANPTVTDTLTNALPTATTVCEINIHGGTHTPAAGESFAQIALSATAPQFQFNGTPTAGGTTYVVTRRCGP